MTSCDNSTLPAFEQDCDCRQHSAELALISEVMKWQYVKLYEITVQGYLILCFPVIS